MDEISPVVFVANRQRRVRLDRADLQRFAERARMLAAGLPRPGSPALPSEISVVFVSDRKIRELHRDFMGLDTPTDVITFQHGEILISVDTAARQAAQYGTDAVRELKLYILHGLLHLRGYDDQTQAASREMRAVQTRLFTRLLRSAAGGDPGPDPPPYTGSREG